MEKLTSRQGKTFIFDISTLDVDALRATYKLARADEEQIGALRACIEEHLPALKKQCDMVMVKESGGVDESANVAALTLYNEYVGVLYQKLYSMRLEVGHVRCSCYGRLADTLGFY